jgi:hypothetical protein
LSSLKTTPIVLLLAALMASACTSAPTPTTTPPPTQALNTAVPTDTPTLPPAPTATVTQPPSAAEVGLTEAARQTASAPAPDGTPTDPVAEELAALAVDRFAREENISAQTIRVVEIETVVWPDASLGCGTPAPTPDGATAAPGIPGYRILVQVRPAGASATYHTDFIRVIRCDGE